MQNNQPPQRGDDFDGVGGGSSSGSEVSNPQRYPTTTRSKFRDGQGALLSKVLAEPGRLADVLNLNDEQAKNVKSLIVGVGAGFGHKYLAPLLGDEIAAGLSAMGSAWLAKRVVKRAKEGGSSNG